MTKDEKYALIEQQCDEIREHVISTIDIKHLLAVISGLDADDLHAVYRYTLMLIEHEQKRDKG